MLERTPESLHTPIDAERANEPARPEGGRLRRFAHGAWQFFVWQSFSSLTRRILFLNITGLLALVIGILYLSQFRAGLIEARTQSLMVYAEIIAEAIATSATVEGNTITVDPDRLLDLKPGESYGVSDEYGAKALENPVHTHDFHATILHLLGLDHTRLTYRYSGRDFRLTDVEGNVLKQILA